MKDDPVQLRLRYVYEDVDRHGNVRVYFWRGRGHKKHRITSPAGSDEFMAMYRALLDQAEAAPAADQAPGAPREGTLGWLCLAYFASAEFGALDPRTRRVRRGVIEHCLAEPIKPGSPITFGAVPVAQITAEAVYVLRDRKAAFPEAGNNRVKAIRQVFRWGLVRHRKLVAANPARDVEYFASRPDGFHTWSVDEVQKFEERHEVGSKARLALALLLYAGVRRSDVVRLGRQHERGGRLEFTAFKGRNKSPAEISVPILPELAAIIKATPSGGMTYLLTEFGRPYTAAGFGNWFRRRCDEAGLPHCSAHGVRKAGATIAAENGATEHELMAIFGWETPKQAARYTRKANRARLADRAMHHVVPQSFPPAGADAFPTDVKPLKK